MADPQLPPQLPPNWAELLEQLLGPRLAGLLLIGGAALAFLPKVLKEWIARRREYNDASDRKQRRKLDLQKLAQQQLREAFDSITERLEQENELLRRRIEILEERQDEFEEENRKLRARIRELESHPAPSADGRKE